MLLKETIKTIELVRKLLNDHANDICNCENLTCEDKDFLLRNPLTAFHELERHLKDTTGDAINLGLKPGALNYFTEG